MIENMGIGSTFVLESNKDQSGAISYSDPPKSLSLIPLIRRKIRDSCSSSTSLMHSDSSYDTFKQTFDSPRCVSHFDRLDSRTSKLALPNLYKDEDDKNRPPLPTLRRDLLKHYEEQDPKEHYKFTDVIGTGSMGHVLRVKKRREVIGGSARPSFVKRNKRRKADAPAYNNMLLSCFLFCPLSRSSNHPSHQDIFQDMTDKDDNEDYLPKEYLNVTEDSDFDHAHSKDLVYAIKTTRLDHPPSSAFVGELQNEVDILKDLDHPNIVRAFETFSHKKKHFVVMECCNGGNLYSRDPYTETDAAKITSSLLDAVAYMHSKNIIHRDIKFENILFTSTDLNAEVKLIDFGLSTSYTMAPELLKAEYSSSIDVWAIGVLAYMLLSSTVPFFGKERGKYSFHARCWNNISIEARQFVSSLLEVDPEQRPTAKQALLYSSWLNNQENLLLRQQQDDIMVSSIDSNKDKVIASMETFAEYGMLKKISLMIVAFQSTSEEIGFLRRMFDDEFVGENHEVTYCEYRTFMEEYLYSDEEVARIFNSIDIFRNGVINYSEFLASTIEACGSIQEEKLAEAFNRLDCDDSGYISVSDLEELLQTKNEKENGKNSNNNIARAFIKNMIKEADLDNDGMVSYSDFLAMWHVECSFSG